MLKWKYKITPPSVILNGVRNLLGNGGQRDPSLRPFAYAKGLALDDGGGVKNKIVLWMKNLLPFIL
ncbi:MAG: hypothetical protein A2Y82_02575 [Candidatus Buchananbacteria bacterium RBG_13_36_9]|uniref:Uncharacterized protein n=1 Tax=Candidatus Buchananbacteria bacterium RBG_13_36_9 TaxID=1797530 RepID=A0A1G1XQ74_9BACT|nr:MAG: hypothetical protein A2Y82_02575 [Candidatus Buchananbacteria bacterium RBG_13_36_9]